MNSRTSAVEKTATGVPDRVEFVGVPVGHHTQPDNFNLEQFEFQVTQPDTELAARMLFFLLEQLDSNYGQWGPQFSAYSPGTALEGLNPVLCTRIAGAVTTLFSRPDFTVSDGGYIQLMNLHRWLALIFAVSLYRHADHIIRNINAAGGGVVNRGQTAADNPEIQGPPKKPVMLVVLEWFTGQHSVYRTHSRALAALRGRFIVHAVGLDMAVDSAGRQVFDVFHGVSTASALQEAYVLASELRPDVVLYAGIGMFPFTIYLSNLRLAPLQLVGLGHGASTFCGQINGFVIEEDLVGEERCFSEAVIRVPADAMPFVPPADIRRVPVTRTPFLTRQQAQWREPLPVRVAVCASVMKINPNFLSTLAEVQRRSRVAMQFCFYMGFAQGLTLDYLRDAIHAVLPGAEVNGHMPVQAYQAALNSCELFVSPFPYGNMNGVVDAVRQGLPGVCLSGPEVHSHIDGGLFRRLGLPEELIATGYEAYIRAVLRLVEEHDWREMLQHRLLDNDVEQVLFQGHPEKFAAVISDAWQQVRLGVVPSGTVPKARRRKSL